MCSKAKHHRKHFTYSLSKQSFGALAGPTENTSRDRYPLLYDVTADTKKTGHGCCGCCLAMDLHVTMHKSCPCAQIIKQYAMKIYGGVDVWIQVFLTSALVGGVVSFKPWPLYLRRKNPRYPLDRRLVRPQNRSRQRVEMKNLAPTGT
jgi:hypothetical protein